MQDTSYLDQTKRISDHCSVSLKLEKGSSERVGGSLLVKHGRHYNSASTDRAALLALQDVSVSEYSGTLVSDFIAAILNPTGLPVSTWITSR